MKLILGTRGSKLAVAQSSIVARSIEEHTGVAVELKVIQTRGDAILDKPLAEIGGKGLFTLELENALRTGEIDFAVHSCKDLPTDNVPGLDIVCFPKREDPRDALVGRLICSGSIVGTGSSRRQDQIARLQDVTFKGIRGNIDTRITKMEQGEYDCVVLAMAGLNRAAIQRSDIRPLEISECVPAPAQGALALQARVGDDRVIQLLRMIHDVDTELAVSAERRFMSQLGGGCHASLGAFVQRIEQNFEMTVFVQTDKGSRRVYDEHVDLTQLVEGLIQQVSNLY